MPHVYDEDTPEGNMTFDNIPNFSNPRTGITQPDECGGICRRTTSRMTISLAIFFLTLYVLQIA